MGRYAVVDIETTGLSSAGGDRIVEIGVVLVDEVGALGAEWETLIDPERDVGANRIHGLASADLRGAPTFDRIAGDLELLLRGRVPVAHNLAFDAPFIAAEYRRLGYDVPLGTDFGLCTMRLAKDYLPGGQRTLEACCERIGYGNPCAHSALDDARAAAHLLVRYIKEPDFAIRCSATIQRAYTATWPDIEPLGTPRISRTSPETEPQQSFVSRLVSRPPRTEMYREGYGYLALLDRIMPDRLLTRLSADELVSAAQVADLSREEVLLLHRAYLGALARLAKADGTPAVTLRADVEGVAVALGLTPTDVDEVLMA